MSVAKHAMTDNWCDFISRLIFTSEAWNGIHTKRACCTKCT